MNSVFRLFLVLALVPGLLFAAEPSDPLPCSSDWENEAEIAREKGVPILIVFTSETCMPCEALKSQLIDPMRRDERLGNRVHITEFDINRGGKITDFDGERIRSRIFVSRYDVFATPTVVLLDYRGEILSKPLVGYDASDEYSERLNSAILHAATELAATTTHMAIARNWAD